MQHVDPHSIVKSVKAWLPSLNKERIIKFFKEAYELEDDEQPKHQNSTIKVKNADNFPSVGKKV